MSKFEVMCRGALCVFVMLGLAACAPTVKLDEPAQVVDVKPVPVNSAPVQATTTVAAARPTGTGATSSPTDNRQVTPVNTTGTTPATGDLQPPTSLARTVFFDYDSFQIRPEAQVVLEAHARYLKGNSARRANLEGHTDERGGREYNLALGQRRAQAVASALRLLGVADAQTEAVSFGKEKPASTGSDEAAWAKNRRVELFYK